MARAFILSHGTRVESIDPTFVPTGRSIAFYSEFDQNTLRTVGLAALNAGDIKPTETFTAGQPVSNYILSNFEDSALAEHLANESSRTDGTPYYVGDGPVPAMAALCTTPAKCATTKPLHHGDCKGLFNLVSEDEILSVSCRGVMGQKNAATYEMAGDKGGFMKEMTEEAKRIIDWAVYAPDAAREYWQSLTEATRTQLRGAHTGLIKLADEWDKAGAFTTSEAVLGARRYLEAYGDETFYDWLPTIDPQQRAFILADDGLREVQARVKGRREQAQRDELLAGAPEVDVDPMAALAARIDEQAKAIAQSVSLWAGDDTDDIDTVSLAYQTLMGDVGSFQAGATDGWASSAASLYAAGADLGMALAMHNEQRDAESLQGVTAALDLVCQWSASLVSA